MIPNAKKRKDIKVYKANFNKPKKLYIKMKSSCEIKPTEKSFSQKRKKKNSKDKDISFRNLPLNVLPEIIEDKYSFNEHNSVLNIKKIKPNQMNKKKQSKILLINQKNSNKNEEEKEKKDKIIKEINPNPSINLEEKSKMNQNPSNNLAEKSKIKKKFGSCQTLKRCKTIVYKKPNKKEIRSQENEEETNCNNLSKDIKKMVFKNEMAQQKKLKKNNNNNIITNNNNIKNDKEKSENFAIKIKRKILCCLYI